MNNKIYTIYLDFLHRSSAFSSLLPEKPKESPTPAAASKEGSESQAGQDGDESETNIDGKILCLFSVFNEDLFITHSCYGKNGESYRTHTPRTQCGS